MKTVYLEKSDIGATLTTWVYCAMWQLFAAEAEGKQVYINWPATPGRSLQPYQDPAAFARQPNMYDWYFEQPHVAQPPPREEVWEWESRENGEHVGKHQLFGLPMPELKAFYRKNCRLNSDVNVRGEALAAKYGVDFSNTLAVSWRGTDCVLDGRPRLPIEVYFPFIEDILEKEPSLRIFATAEEEGILSPLVSRYGSRVFTVSEFYASPNGCKDNPERFSPFSGHERGMQPALMVWFLSRCKHYIKNRSSVGATASWLSQGNIVCLAHPLNLGHGFDLTKAEVDGKLVPLYR